MSPFNWYMVAWYASRGYRMTDQKKKGWMQTPAGPHCAGSKQNNAWVGWKQEVSQLSACHLAVSLSRVCYNTSYERGHSGLPADTKIRTIVQLIGILWSYFGVQLGSANSPLLFCLSLCNLLAHIRLPYIIWKGTSIGLIWGIVACPAPRGCWVTASVTL